MLTEGLCFAVSEDDLSQSLKNGYLLMEDEIDHVGVLLCISFFVVIFLSSLV